MTLPRLALAPLALALALACAAAPPPQPEPWRLLAKGTDGSQTSRDDGGGGRRRAPWIELAGDRESLEALWREHVPGTPGDVDFSSETVVFLLLGVQETGGYAIEPVAADPPADGVLRVHARLIQPMGDEPVTEALTAPYAVIAVRARGITKVEWMNEGRLLATKVVE